MFNFTSSKKTPRHTDDVFQESVEICDGEDGCGYAKKNCICDYLKKQKASGPQTKLDSNMEGRMSSQSIETE